MSIYEPTKRYEQSGETISTDDAYCTSCGAKQNDACKGAGISEEVESKWFYPAGNLCHTRPEPAPVIPVAPVKEEPRCKKYGAVVPKGTTLCWKCTTSASIADKTAAEHGGGKKTSPVKSVGSETPWKRPGPIHRYPVNTESYPWFERSEFVGTQLREKPYVIERLPEIGATPSINWVQVLSAPVAMLMIAFILMAAGMSNMLMMLPMQLVGVVTAVISYYSQKKKYNKNSNDREVKYEKYLAEVEKELEEIVQNQREALRQANPIGESCKDIVLNRKGILWSRDIQRKGFLEVPLGEGQADLSCPISVHRPGRFDNDVNSLSLRAVALADQYKKIDGIPITFSLMQNNSVAVIGNREHRTAMLQQILISLSTMHTPEDLKIAIVYSKEEEKDWSFFRFLPHIWDTNKTTRLIADTDDGIADTDDGIKALLNHFANLADSRQRAAEEYRASPPTPFYVLIVTNPKYLNQITNAGRLLPHSPAKGMTTLVATGGSIPSGCRHIIEVQLDSNGALQGSVYPTSDRKNITQFCTSPLSCKDVEEIVRSMAPIRLKAGREGKGLPSFISLFKGRNINTPEEMKIEDAWKRFKASDSMAVSLGVGSDGKEVIFDIHEKRDGPMGLVAGTTRSGKTELLQTWIIQMASKFSPQEVNFVLFDFKGTSLIDPLKALPHLVGDISNTEQDDSGQDFELRYCTALNSERIRRQNLLTITGSTNILDYQKKYHDKQNEQVTEPMPFLMIILDEFARIKDEHPNFMRLANGLYSTGGSLGMYVILSTQNPASAISPEIRANSAFQLCARVTDNQDSREMIGVPDAAHLPKIPGRAFLRVSAQGTLQCFQAYYAGAAYDAETQMSEDAMPAALIEVNGNALPVEIEKPDFTELEAAVGDICRVAKSIKIPAAHKVWLPPLDKKISIYDVLKIKPGEESLREKAPAELTAVVGLTDDPARQVQYNTELNFAQYGSAVVCGGPTSGKTTFLLTAAISLIHQYSPERVRMYFIDGGGGVLRSLERFPHTARCLNAHMQPQDCGGIITQLQNEVGARQQKFAARNVPDISSYRRLTGEAISDILLVIDDIGQVRNLPVDNGFVNNIAYMLQFGPANGIYLLLSACNQRDLYRLADNIRHEMRFVLHMPEITDAREMLGLPARPPMITIKGRGLHIDASGERRPLVFQTAQPWTVDDRALQMTRLQELGQTMTASCNIVFDDQPQEIPEHIPYGSIPTLENGITLGLALDGSGIVGNYSDPDTSVLTLVSEDSALHFSVAAMITKQAAQRGQYKKEFAISTGADAVSILEKLRTTVTANMQNRCAEKNLLVIYDFPEVYCGLSDELRTLLDKCILYGGTRFGVDCLFTAAPKQLAELPENDGGVTPANISLFRRPMLYLDNAVVTTNARFRTEDQNNQPMGAEDVGAEDAAYVRGFDERRYAVRIRRMLNR